jgi:hypothetical protein
MERERKAAANGRTQVPLLKSSKENVTAGLAKDNAREEQIVHGPIHPIPVVVKEANHQAKEKGEAKARKETAQNLQTQLREANLHQANLTHMRADFLNPALATKARTATFGIHLIASILRQATAL